MKVWELIRNNFDDTKDMDRESLKTEICIHRWIPCEIEKHHNILKGNKFDFMDLMNCDGDCEKCLDKYLDIDK